MTRETLVLLTGMMCDGRLFAPQIEAFGPHYDIIVGELTDADTIEGLANQILDRIGAGPFNLVGLSMGGIVAMAIAGLARSQVRRLALLDTNHRPDSSERRALRDLQIANVLAGRLQAVIVDEMKPHYLAEPNRKNRSLLHLLIDMALGLGEEVFVQQSRALRDRSDQSATLKAFEGPALVLCGQQDELCPVERHQEIASLLKRADFVVIENAGHMTTLEAPTAVNIALQSWLQRRVLRDPE